MTKEWEKPEDLRRRKPVLWLTMTALFMAMEKGFEITGLEKFEGKEDYFCFHAGTKFNEAGKIVTNGGRVLGITATGANLKEARKKAYEATEWVNFANKYMRHDIGKAIDEA